MIGRSAGDDDGLADVRKTAAAMPDLVQQDLARVQGDPAHQGVPDDLGLLEDFLEHEMLEALLFDHQGVPGDLLDFLLDRVGP